MNPNGAANALLAATEALAAWGTNRLAKAPADAVMAPLVGVVACWAGAVCFGSVMTAYNVIMRPPQPPTTEGNKR